MENESKNNRVMLIGALLIALVFVFTLFRSEIGKDKSEDSTVKKEVEDYPKITAEDLKTRILGGNDIQIIDIRSSDDYNTEHIIDSININSEGSFDNIPQGKAIAILGYSNGSDNFPKIINSLKDKKFNDASVLTGGIASWKKSGGSTISFGNLESFTDNSKVNYITPEDLKIMTDNKNYPKYVIDLRSKQSFDSGHLPEAENIPLENLESSRSKIPSGKEIFVYGDNDVQGFQAGVRLFDLNFFSAKVLIGGFPSWKEKGFPIVK